MFCLYTVDGTIKRIINNLRWKKINNECFWKQLVCSCTFLYTTIPIIIDIQYIIITEFKNKKVQARWTCNKKLNINTNTYLFFVYYA